MAEYSEAERALLTLDGVEAWREQQKSLLTELRGKATGLSDAYVKEFTEGIEGSLDGYLQAHGITDDSDNYDSIRGIFRDASIDRINDEHWYTSPAARQEVSQDTASGRDNFAQRLKELSA